jgi:predicted  nucleic acid-binding Zn-ribbon protein
MNCVICDDKLGSNYSYFLLAKKNAAGVKVTSKVCGSCHAHIEQTVRNLKLIYREAKQAASIKGE